MAVERDAITHRFLLPVLTKGLDSARISSLCSLSRLSLYWTVISGV